MAVTKIWSIKGRAGSPLEYVTNPDKTQHVFNEFEKQALADVIAYAANEDKTDRLFYTTGINCSVECARDQFDTTKLRFGKIGGNVAYHAYQSFAPGEVTPDEAHAIGVQLAKELWGDRFQIVVATHLDRDHIHNHIIINSVSFVDGKKLHGCRDNTTRLRDTSDRICKEHGLSVIDRPKGKRVSTYLYKMEKAGMPTRYNVARQAIDESVALSLNLEEFKSELGERMEMLSRERDELRLVIKRVVPEETITEARKEIRELTSEIKTLRRELKVCTAIQERSDFVREPQNF